MFVRTLNGTEFEGLARDLLEKGHTLRFRAHGISMRPFIQDGDLVDITPIEAEKVRRGDVVLCSCPPGRMLLHRVIRIYRKGYPRRLLIQGDAIRNPDDCVDFDQVLGRARFVQHGKRIYRLDSLLFRSFFWLWALAWPLIKKISYRNVKRIGRGG